METRVYFPTTSAIISSHDKILPYTLDQLKKMLIPKVRIDIRCNCCYMINEDGDEVPDSLTNDELSCNGVIKEIIPLIEGRNRKIKIITYDDEDEEATNEAEIVQDLGKYSGIGKNLTWWIFSHNIPHPISTFIINGRDYMISQLSTASIYQNFNISSLS